jgi:hypothetical protein
MTVEAWVDPTSLSSPDAGWDAVVAKEHQNSSNDIAYALYAAQGTGTGPAGHVLVGSNDNGTSGGSALPLNTWSFLTATYDGTTLRTYVNGTQVASKAVSGNIVTTSNPLRIGGDWSAEMFTGLIDNVRIYNKALTAAQIQTDMGTAVGGGGSPAIALPTGGKTAVNPPGAGGANPSGGATAAVLAPTQAVRPSAPPGLASPGPASVSPSAGVAFELAQTIVLANQLVLGTESPVVPAGDDPDGHFPHLPPGPGAVAAKRRDTTSLDTLFARASKLKAVQPSPEDAAPADPFSPPG